MEYTSLEQYILQVSVKIMRGSKVHESVVRNVRATQRMSHIYEPRAEGACNKILCVPENHKVDK